MQHDQNNLRPVIRVELQGGLGNQLFQAAAGFVLSRQLNGCLQLDLSRFRPGRARSYALQLFAHDAELVHASQNRVQSLLRQLGKALSGKLPKTPQGWRGAVFEERSFGYDPRIRTVEGDCYLRGYFQSWRYLDAYAQEVRKAFDPFAGASDRARDLSAELGAGSLAIHVRAGDFLKDPKTNAVHGVLPAEYYRSALSRVRASRPVSRIFVFSDNLPVARTLLADEPDVTFVEGFSAHDDLYLMSRADSHIIANSTFSYWSAWLDARPDAFVIAPHAWFTEEELKKTSIADLYPPSWVRL